MKTLAFSEALFYKFPAEKNLITKNSRKNSIFF